MTDVIDDSLSWEQRREMRRKKRQELLAEADRLVKKTDESSTRVSRDTSLYTSTVDDDTFEKERMQRRKEREERRRREREELEKQLKDEEELRVERDKRREERRRQREAVDKELTESSTKASRSYTPRSAAVEDMPAAAADDADSGDPLPSLENGHHDNGDEEVENDATEEDPADSAVNGEIAATEEEDVDEVDNAEVEEVEDEEQPEDDDVQQEDGGAEPVDGGSGQEDESFSDHQPEVEPEVPDAVEKKTFKSVTSPNTAANVDEENEVKRKLKELKLKRQQSDRMKYTLDAATTGDTGGESAAERVKRLEERKKAREQQRLEEEERERREAAERKAKYEEQQKQEREERERRRAEAEEKRQQYRKTLSQSEDLGSPLSPGPLSPKNLTSPLSVKVEQLNKHITDSPKTVKTTPLVKAESLNLRREKYTQQATKQKTTGKEAGGKTVVGEDVSSRKNRWERGEVVAAADKQPARKDASAVVAGKLATRKNMWESGQVASPSAASSKTSADVKRKDLSSMKNLYLKNATQQGSPGARKAESPVAIKTGVMSRLNQWEKGDVVNATPDKTKSKVGASLTPGTVSGVGDRLNKWKNITSETPSEGQQHKPAVRVIGGAGMSARKNMWESKAAAAVESPDRAEMKEPSENSYDGAGCDDDGEDVSSVRSETESDEMS